MNSKYNGELRLADGTLVKCVDWHLEYNESIEMPVKPDFRGIFNSSFQASGTLTSADIDALLDLMPDHYLQPEVCVYVPRHRYWMLKYAQQGKWYPRPRRQRSKARMSKKWREHERS